MNAYFQVFHALFQGVHRGDHARGAQVMVPRQAVEAQDHDGLAHEQQAPRAYDPLGKMAPGAREIGIGRRRSQTIERRILQVK